MRKPICALAVITLAIQAVGYCQQREKSDKPNILFIFADDQTFASLGALNPEVRTPNLDKLLRSGTFFMNAYNQGAFSPAVCVASRTMLVTGSFLWKAAGFSSKANNRDKNAPPRMPEYFVPQREPSGYWPLEMKAAGYETYLAGKWHLPFKPQELFDHVGTVRGGMPNQSDVRYERAFNPNEPDTWSPYDESFGGYWKGGKHWSEVLCDETLAFLEQSRNSQHPFFMYIAFNAPHDPRQSPKEYVDMYPLDKISVPENFMPLYPYHEEIGAGKSLRDEKLAPFPRTEYSIKVNRREYYALISHLDTQIGRILEALKKTAQDKNTYIIFSADHGLAVGDHGFIGKQNMYEASMKVPLIIAGPGVKKNHRVPAFVYLQDIMPTTLDIAGAKKPDYVDYHSLLPLAKGDSRKSAYDAVYGGYMGTQRMIRDERYKMIIYPVPNVVRLYDLETDPKEMKDLASDVKYRPVMENLFARFRKLQEEVGDPLDVRDYYEGFFRAKQ